MFDFLFPQKPEKKIVRAIQKALFKGKIDLATKLLEDLKKHDPQKKQLNKLLHFLGAKCRKISLIDVCRFTEILIREGADPNFRDKKNFVPLFYAVKSGYFPYVKVLWENGAKLDIFVGDDVPLFHYVVQYCNLDIIRFFLEKGADLRKQNSYGQDAVFAVLNEGDTEADAVEVLKLLMEYGADLYQYDRDGYQPLHRAVLHGKVSAVKYLLKQGIDKNIRTRDEHRDTPCELIQAYEALFSGEDYLPEQVKQNLLALQELLCDA